MPLFDPNTPASRRQRPAGTYTPAPTAFACLPTDLAYAADEIPAGNHSTPAHARCGRRVSRPVTNPHRKSGPARPVLPARQQRRTPGYRIACRMLFILICLGMCLPLCGCMRAENNAIEGLISPSVIGIDATENGYRITVSALSPSSDLTSNEVINDVYTAQSPTLDEAVNSLTGSVNRTIFKGHIRYVIFGKQMSGEQIATCIDYLVRDRDISSSCEAYTCESNDAYDLIRLLCEGNTRSVHENLSSLGDDNAYIGSTEPLTILHLSEFRLTQDNRFYLPCIELVDFHGKSVAGAQTNVSADSAGEGSQEGESGDTSSAPGDDGGKSSSSSQYFLRYTGARLYCEDGPVSIDFPTFRGMNMALTPTSICHLSVTLPSGRTVGLNATDIQFERSIRIVDARAIATIKVRFLSSLSGVDEETLLIDDQMLAQITQAQNELVQEDIENALVLLQENGFDLIDIKRALPARYPFSEEVRQQADELFASAHITVEVASVIVKD